MEKTIKERALEYAGLKDEPDGEKRYYNRFGCGLYDTYIKVAKEQRQIDIEKACHLFKELKEWNIMYDGNFDKAVDAFRKNGGIRSMTIQEFQSLSLEQQLAVIDTYGESCYSSGMFDGHCLEWGDQIEGKRTFGDHLTYYVIKDNHIFIEGTKEGEEDFQII